MVSIYKGLHFFLVARFKGCHDRVRDGKCPSIQWPRNREGCIDFIDVLGLPPLSMDRPTVGRIDHKKGYEVGNIRWEEYRHNSVKRRGTKWENFEGPEVIFKVKKFRKGTPEHIEHQRQASARRWSDPKQHEAARQRFIENNPQRRKTCQKSN